MKNLLVVLASSLLLACGASEAGGVDAGPADAGAPDYSSSPVHGTLGLSFWRGIEDAPTLDVLPFLGPPKVPYDRYGDCFVEVADDYRDGLKELGQVTMTLAGMDFDVELDGVTVRVDPALVIPGETLRAVATGQDEVPAFDAEVVIPEPFDGQILALDEGISRSEYLEATWQPADPGTPGAEVAFYAWSSGFQVTCVVPDAAGSLKVAPALWEPMADGPVFLLLGRRARTHVGPDGFALWLEAADLVHFSGELLP